MFTVATIYCLAAILAFVLAAPVALLAPVFFAVTIQLPAETVEAPTAIVVQAEAAPTTCAPFVAVYAARGESRPTVHAWSLCETRPLALHVDRNAMPLRGAARRVSLAKAGRVACTSHACPTVRL